jgi:hypothetical protein
MKDDTVSDRVHSFIKRLLQIGIHSDANVLVGILALVQKVCQERADFVKYDVTGAGMKNLLDEDDSEHATDAEDSDHESEDVALGNDDAASELSGTEKNLKALDNEALEPEKKPDHVQGFSYLKLKSKYDPFAREPIYSGAKNTLYFE